MSADTEKGRLADLPFAERLALDAEKHRELQEGLTRRHVQNARESDLQSAANLARAIQFAANHG